MSNLIQDLDHFAAVARRIAGRQCESKTSYYTVQGRDSGLNWVVRVEKHYGEL